MCCFKAAVRGVEGCSERPSCVGLPLTATWLNEIITFRPAARVLSQSFKTVHAKGRLLAWNDVIKVGIDAV